MLRKRTRSHQKDQQMGHSASDSSDSLSNSDAFLKQKHKTNSFFTVSGLFVGLSAKASDCDSVRSPTSPLESRVFSKSNIVNPYRFPKPSNEGTQKVGLSIIDQLFGDTKDSGKAIKSSDTKDSGKAIKSSDSKNILFGPQMRIKIPDLITRLNSFEATNSLPKDYGISAHARIKPSNPQMNGSDDLLETRNGSSGKFWSFSLDSASSGSHLSALNNRRIGSSSENSVLKNESNIVSSPLAMNPMPISNGSAIDILGSLTASEIELSEEYTCVRTHGPNPKTTHIYCDCILECRDNELFINSPKNQVPEASLFSAEEAAPEVPSSYPSDNFLSFCYSCKKNLEGEDIYMYRGEKAFCSLDCRSEEILIEEKMEKENKGFSEETVKSKSYEDLSESAIFIAA